jgi:hypothetical protein
MGSIRTFTTRLIRPLRRFLGRCLEKDVPERARTVIHESGHAIIAALDNNLASASLHPPQVRSLRGSNPLTTLAGAAACAAIKFPDPGRGAWVDLFRVCRKFNMDEEAIKKQIVALIHFFRSDTGLHLLNTVAYELSNKGRLTGDAVQAMIEPMRDEARKMLGFDCEQKK